MTVFDTKHWHDYRRETSSKYIRRYLSLAENNKLPTSEDYQRLDIECQNLQAVIDHAISNKQWQVLSSLAWGLGPSWEVRVGFLYFISQSVKLTFYVQKCTMI